MSKKNILNLTLFVIVVILTMVIYLSEEKNIALKTLTDMNLNNVSTINIQHNKNTTIIVKDKENKWQITQPTNIAANNFRIKSIVKLLNAPVHNQYSVTELDLRSIGLEQPKTTIQFNKTRIEFGITNPVTNLRYLRLNDIIYTIEDVYYPLLASHFGTLVSLNLLPANSKIEKLILINQTITKDANNKWQSNITISADNINNTIDHWLHDQAFGVHEYLQREMLGEVFIYLADKKQPVSYIITDTAPWLIIARPETGLEYHLDIEAYNKLIVPQ